MDNPHTSQAGVLLLDAFGDGAPRVQGWLGQAGWRCCLVTDPLDAFAEVRAGKVDVALLRLPVDDAIGMDLPGVFHRLGQPGYLPVMILTDSHEQQQRCRFLDSGADDVVAEGTSREEIVARVRSLLRFRAVQTELCESRRRLEEALQREKDLLVQVQRDNAALREMATTDPLTHVHNVRSFNELLCHSFSVAKRYDQQLSALMLDLDHFKLVNDSYGHPAGDYVLKELAVILKQTVRDSDIVARVGGEEFAVLLPKADRRKAAQLAQRIRREVYRRKFVAFGRDIHVTVSIGSATYYEDAEVGDADMLMFFADQALLRAKETGRDRHVPLDAFSAFERACLRQKFLARQQGTGEAGAVESPSARAGWRDGTTAGNKQKS